MSTIVKDNGNANKAIMVIENWENDCQFEVVSDKEVKKALRASIHDALSLITLDASRVAYQGFKFKPEGICFLAFFDCCDTILQACFYLKPKRDEWIKKSLRAKLLKSGTSLYFLKDDKFLSITFAEGEKLLNKEEVLSILNQN